MKKLLLTLFAIAAIVACQKEDQSDLVAQPEASIDIQVGTNESAQIGQAELDDIISDLISNLSGITPTKRGNASSSKGSDYVAIHVFTLTGSDTRYLTLLDETNDDLCFATGQSTALVYFDNVNGDGSVLVVEDDQEVEQLRISGNFGSFFDAGQNTLLALTDPRQQGTFDDSNAVSLNGIDFNFSCFDPADHYEVMPAPFPLSGFLARITGPLPDGMSSANYAGTSTSTVIEAIENDIMN